MKTQIKEYGFLGLFLYLPVLSSPFATIAVCDLKEYGMMAFLGYLDFQFSSYFWVFNSVQISSVSWA